MINRILPHMLSLFLPQRNASMSDRSPTSDFWYSAVGRQTKSGIQVTDEEALCYSAVWACTRILSSTGGRLPLNLYRRGSNRGKAIVKTDYRDRLVFRRPNEHMTPSLFKSQGLIRQINCGNSYSEIQRDNFSGQAVAFHPIHNSRVKPVIDDKTDDLYYEIKNNDGSKVYIESPDMLHVPSMMTHNGIVGLGVLDHARESIGLGLATERSGATVFGSGALPRVVVESPKKWSSDSRANFRKEWKEIYGGVDGDKVGVMDEGSKLHVLGVNHEQLQFLATRQHNVEELARWYGVPPHKIQHLLRSTNNNIEHQALEFITDSLMPWLVIWEEEMDRKLLTEEEQQDMFFAFDVSQYLRGDMLSRAEYWSKMVNGSIAARNEARIEEDLNPVPGGDTFLVQGAMVALDENGVPMVNGSKSDTRNDPPPTGGPDGDDDDGDDETEAETAQAVLVSAAKAMLEGCLTRMLHKEATAARRAANKPGEFLKWLEEFYGKHSQQLDEALAHVGKACEVLGYPIEGLAANCVHESETALLELACQETALTLAEAVDRLVSDWETVRVAVVVDGVFKGGET